MEDKIDLILSKITLLDKVASDVEETKLEISSIKQKYAEMNEKVSVLEEKIETQDATIINLLDKKLRKRNLIIYGIPEIETSQAELSSKVKQIMYEKLKINVQDTEIE